LPVSVAYPAYLRDKARTLRREDHLSIDEIALCLALSRSLYIAEGYKRNRNVVSIANSDPAVIKVSARWLRHFSGRTLDCSVQFHADQDLRKLRSFWGTALDIEPTGIRLLRKSNSSRLVGRRWRCLYGVMTLRVSDTALRARLQGWIDSMKEQWLDSSAFGA
jgi:hypothetical protein